MCGTLKSRKFCTKAQFCMRIEGTASDFPRGVFAAGSPHRPVRDPQPGGRRRRPGGGEPRMGRPAGAPAGAATPAGAPAAARAAAAAPTTPARGSAKREDKDSLTVGSHTAVRRLARRREDKDSPEFLIFPHPTPPRRLPRPRRVRRPRRPLRARRAMSAFSRPSIRRLNAQPEGRGWSIGIRRRLRWQWQHDRRQLRHLRAERGDG